MPDVPGSVPPRRDLAISPLPPPVQRENGFDAAHSAGLFIGVNQFTIDRNLAPIPFAVDDAVDLAWTFSAELNLIRFEQIVLCLGGAPRKPETAERLERLREAGATCHGGSRTEIGLALVEFADLARPEGLMVASVSTHGFEVGGAHYFLATDSARRIAAESAIPVATLKRELMRPAGVRRRLLLVDTCRERLDTGEAKRVGGGLNPSLATELGKAEGFAALFATVAEGYSYDDPVAGNGVFTAGVLQGLRGSAPTDDGGFLRVGALAGYVDQHVRGWIRANNPHVGHPPGITRNMESDAELLPLAFDETKWSARREADRLAAERAAEEARLREEAIAKARAEEQARLAAIASERRAAEAALAERIRLARQRIGAAAGVDDAIADRLPSITAALRDWPADRRNQLLTEIEALDPENPRLRHYFTEVAWKQLAPEWTPAPSSSSTAAPKVVEVKPPEPPRTVYTPPPNPPPPPPQAPKATAPAPLPIYPTSKPVQAPTPKAPGKPFSTRAKAGIAFVLLVVAVIGGGLVYDAVRPARKIVVDSLPTPTEVQTPIVVATPRATPAPTPRPTPTATPQPTPRQTPVATVVDPFSAPAPAARPTMPSTSNPKPGDRREVDLGGGVKMGLVWAPPGSFQMGSNDGESDEKPVRTVTLTRGFWMGEGEVTVGAWKRFVAETSYRSTAEVEGSGWADLDGDGSWSDEKGASWKNTGFPQTDSHPVVLVSWNDTVKFNEWLSRKAGGTVSLPTEAQWEYACRAGTSSKYFWGDNGENHAAYSNIADQAAKKKFSSLTTSSVNDGYVYTAPVGSFRKNAFGLYDMHGNVCEWCQDWYQDSYNGLATTNPVNTTTGTTRVYRGGSWGLSPARARSAFRNWNTPDNRHVNFGFRVVLPQ